MAAEPSVTPRALEKLQTISEQQGGGGMRLAVRGGGCSGLSYSMEWAAGPNPTDLVLGGLVFVDKKSLLFLGSSELDYVESLAFSGFRVQNPQAKSTCGCGESFSV